MGGSASGHHDGTGQHRRAHKGTAGPSVLTRLPTQRTTAPAERPADAGREPVTGSPPAQRAAVDPCVCGHSRQAHEHYRPGSDCGACGRRGCGAYRPQNSRGLRRGTWPSR